MSLAQTGFELVAKRTRKRDFLDEMNLVIPWTELLALIAPHMPAGITRLPDERTILRFGKTPSQRHLFEEHGLGQQVLAAVNAKLIDRGLMLKTGTVGASLRLARREHSGCSFGHLLGFTRQGSQVHTLHHPPKHFKRPVQRHRRAFFVARPRA